MQSVEGSLSGSSIARDSLSGITIAFLVQSVDHSLSSRLILVQSLEGFTIALTIRSLEGITTIRSLDRSLIRLSEGKCSKATLSN